MSTHIGAEPGQIARHVLMPGDPLRAKWIAETFLDDAECYSEVRGMLGYTGTWQGKPVSVQGSGMGLPSISIYLNELFRDYDVSAVTRVGSCGALTKDLALRDLVIASGACTDSGINRVRFEGLDYAAVPDFELMVKAWEAAKQMPVTTKVGLVMSSDSFYLSRTDLTDRMVDYGLLAVEMEANALYTLAAHYRRQALTICTVSDHIITGEETSATERQETFGHMVEVALSAMLG